MMGPRQMIAMIITFRKYNKNSLEHWTGSYRSSRKKHHMHNKSINFSRQKIKMGKEESVLKQLPFILKSTHFIHNDHKQTSKHLNMLELILKGLLILMENCVCCPEIATISKF
jgi:hypothetical protein